MREFIYGRNPVYETLKARRRDAFRLQVAEGAQEKAAWWRSLTSPSGARSP